MGVELLSCFITLLLFVGCYLLVILYKKQGRAGKAIMISIFAALVVAIIVSEIWGKYRAKCKEYDRAINLMAHAEYMWADDYFKELGNFKDSKVLYAYCKAKTDMEFMESDLRYCSGEEYVLSYLNSIPDNYKGPFCEEIAKDKEWVRSGEFLIVCKKNLEVLLAEKARKEAEREAWLAEHASDNANTSNHKYIYIPPTVQKPYYTDPDDYDNPDDFADDAWGLDFDDWDDAYDYWENY